MNLGAMLLPQAVVIALLFARMGGVVLTSPFPGESIPTQHRTALALALAIAAASVAPAPDEAPSIDVGLVALTASELVLGAAIGFVLRALLGAAELAGSIVSQASGLGAASLYNPAAGTQETTIATVFSLLATLLALGAGAHRVLIGFAIDSFRVLPPGRFGSVAATFPSIAALAGGCVETGVRLAIPAIAVSILLQVALALVSRAAPSLQLFNVGFAILILGVLTTVAASFSSLAGAIGDHVASLGPSLDRMLSEVAASR